MTAQVMVFRCGGEAAATKNIFFMFFLPCWGGFRRFPRRRPEKAKLQGGGAAEGGGGASPLPLPPKAAGEG